MSGDTTPLESRKWYIQLTYVRSVDAGSTPEVVIPQDRKFIMNGIAVDNSRTDEAIKKTDAILAEKGKEIMEV
ncbi:hypothetical protein FACS1894167_15420 [Synergistales bacterium]|nr:hypothetical protein FACS1894167_15420 [Synergistales bacterium]